MSKNKKDAYLDEEEKEIIESLKDLDIKTVENDIKNIEELCKKSTKIKPPWPDNLSHLCLCFF